MNCLRCKKPVGDTDEACPACGEKVTSFQRTYATKLIDGKYQILERLGMGGMGEIFKVRHIHLKEERVIKIMRANIASDDQALQRFLAEARTSTMIKHRNLAMLYDFSTLDDGSYYMVWEYIEGTNIQKWMGSHGAMPPRLALEIAIQTLHGLDHLHQMGLIHRDVSPENIMLSQDYQGRLLVKVIDFGIAKQLSDAGSGQGLTQTGMFLGKLKYASPEQAGFLKEGEQLDGRSDLYSFGVVFYEMLAGRAPFVATNPQGYILKHATERPVPISQVNPEANIPARLEEQVFVALEKDRERRHPTGADFAADLEDLRDAVPPDEKFGLGDSPEALDRTGGDRRSDRRASTTGGTRSGTRAGSGTLPDTSSTIVGGQSTTSSATTISGSEPTMVGTLESQGAATVVERKRTVSSAEAEPTLMERVATAIADQPAKRKTGAIAGIAAAVILVIAGAIYFATRPDTPTQEPDITQTGTQGTLPLLPGQGRILLSANPHGELEEIINADTRQPFKSGHEDESTPLRLELPAGNYEIVLTHGDERKQVAVTLAAGEADRRVDVAFEHTVDIDKLSETILRP
ncbi:MAG TPA: serine/threonine-protein kinase [Thermoanaerobaculia bacterium]|nr:serine/threonine-protein kinase [Thermoanaerobaculia bacterium]